MQTSITAILSIRSCIVAEEVKNDVNKKENIDEGWSDDWAKMFEE